MPFNPYADLILFKLECSEAEEPHQFQKVIGELHNQASIKCPVCGLPVDLKEHKRAIKDLIELAAELDKLRGQRK